MSNEMVNLSDSGNFTSLSGLVQRLDEKGWDKIWKPLAGRPKSTVFVFDVVNDRLLYDLSPRDKVGIKSRLLDPLQGIKYKAFAVSDQSKTFRFQTEFIFGDTKIPRTTLEIRIHITQSDDVAISFVEGGDPVKEVCNSIKSDLDMAFKDIRLEDIESLRSFTDQVYGAVKSVEIEHPYLILESTMIQLELPKSIEDAFEKIQEERIRRKTVIESKEREYIEVEKQHRVDKLKREAEFEIDELELARLGITDPKIRLFVRDPQKRAEYLDQIYQQQMDLIEQSREQDKELLKIRLDTIEKFRDKALSEFSGIGELRQLLILIDQTTGIAPVEGILGTVGPDVGQEVIAQLESRRESEDKTIQVDVAASSASPDVKDSSENEDEGMTEEAPSTPSKPSKRERRRR